jgi:hypothetical protein
LAAVTVATPTGDGAIAAGSTATGESTGRLGGVPSPAGHPVKWLVSRRTDLWFACAGASIALLVPMLLILLRGDHELSLLDVVLGELHLGATYGAIMRRQLWRHRPGELLAVPAGILALTYVLSMGGHTILLTSIAMYVAVWHRGRQSLGVARFYQRGMGGPVSRTHDVLFRGAIYLPMLAAALLYAHLAPSDYEGQPYVAFDFGAALTSTLGLAAALWVIAYLAWVLGRAGAAVPGGALGSGWPRIHPGEWWVVIAHAVAFGSGYVLGASNASFILVLAVHHEVQYLYFTYAVTRRPGSLGSEGGPGVIASFLLWPVIGLTGAVVGGWLEFDWLAPLGMGGLLCHYWLDGRIWTQRVTRI